MKNTMQRRYCLQKNNKQVSNNKQNTKNKLMTIYNLSERTLNFSKNIIQLCKKLPKNNINNPIVSQIVRSATSIGANYCEANDSLGKKDFIMRLRIARKEAKETSYWLEIILKLDRELKLEIEKSIKECIEIRNILSSIISKSLS